MSESRRYLNPVIVMEEGFSQRKCDTDVKIVLYDNRVFMVAPNPMDPYVADTAEQMYVRQGYAFKTSMFITKEQFDNNMFWNDG